VTKADLLAGVKDELTRSIEQGTTREEFRAAADKLFEKHGYDKLAPYRIDTIYRTNMASSYQAARYRQMTDPAVVAALPYWRYVAVLDGKTRPAHLEMHGKIFRADSPVWDEWYPPNGYNCRCSVQAVSKGTIEANGWRVEEELPETFDWQNEQTGDLEKLPLTPGEGWEGQPSNLEKALRRQKGETVWQEVAGQLGPAENGRPRWNEIPPEAMRPAPRLLDSLETLQEAHGDDRSQALREVEQTFRRLMGISPKEKKGVLGDPLGEAMEVDIRGLAHVVRKRADARERYLAFLRPTIEDPFEILNTEYRTEAGATKLRKRYLGLFAGPEKGKAICVVADVGPDQTVLWDAFQKELRKVDNFRRGRLLYGR
jgi:SPP1 gp7 family putative phage head morphogenesis protein